MKKKLLTILLSIAVILTSTVTVFAADLGDNPTISQILNTVSRGFPTSDTNVGPSNAWVNDNDAKLYITTYQATSSNRLFCDTEWITTIDKQAIKNQDGNYVYDGTSFTITFKMNGNKLASVKLEGFYAARCNGTYKAPPVKVSDILPPLFPEIKDAGWTNGNSKLYVNSSSLYLDDNALLPTDTILTESDDNFTYTDTDKSYAFYMNSGILEKITLSGFEGSENGDYIAPPVIINNVNFEYTDFDFFDFWYAPELPKAPIGAKYIVDNNNYQVGLIKGTEIVYEYDFTNGCWIDKNDIECNPDISKIEKAFVNFNIVATGANTFADNAVTVTANQKGTAFSKNLNGAEGLFAEGFNLKDTKKIECNLLFDAPVIKEVNINYNEFDFLKFNMECPTTPTEANYNIDSDSFILCLYGETGPIAYSECNDGVWYSNYAMTTPIDIEDIENDVAAGSIILSILADDDYIFSTDLTVKANEKTITEVDDFFDVVEGLQEGYTIDTYNVGGFICLMFKRYEITEGKDAVINVDNNKDVLFTSSAEYNTFYDTDEEKIIGKVLVDDELVDPSNYTHREGSTKITLTDDYLNKLSNGKHKLTIVSTDGNASTYFTITRNPKPNPGYIVPKTGVN